MNNFVIHACEQVLRFTSIDKWDDLTEERKLQFSFNVGVMALGLNLTKEESYQLIIDTSQETLSTQELHKHFRTLIISNKVNINEENVIKPF
jgi:hypothetical protein